MVHTPKKVDNHCLGIYRIRWSGHVCRMEDGRLPKNIYGQLEEHLSMGNPLLLDLSVDPNSATRMY